MRPRSTTGDSNPSVTGFVCSGVWVVEAERSTAVASEDDVNQRCSGLEAGQPKRYAIQTGKTIVFG